MGQLPRADLIRSLHAAVGWVPVHVGACSRVVEAHCPTAWQVGIARVDAINRRPTCIWMIVQALEAAISGDVEPGVHVQLDLFHLLIRVPVYVLHESAQGCFYEIE